MSPQNSGAPELQSKPRVGIPWRTRDEERQAKTEKLNFYFDAVRRAGGEPEHVSLALPADELEKHAARLDAFILPGSPADVDPARYSEPRHAKTTTVDTDRDRTDITILQHALAAHKPVLAICYGCQILNVHLGGSLVQDIPSETAGAYPHGKTDLGATATTKDLEHEATLAERSHLQTFAGASQVNINSSHHQAIARPGEGLRVTAWSTDAIVEGVELQSPQDWVVGVQWHPERMPDDPFAQSLFNEFVRAAQKPRLEASAKR